MKMTKKTICVQREDDQKKTICVQREDEKKTCNQK